MMSASAAAADLMTSVKLGLRYGGYVSLSLIQPKEGLLALAAAITEVAPEVWRPALAAQDGSGFVMCTFETSAGQAVISIHRVPMPPGWHNVVDVSCSLEDLHRRAGNVLVDLSQEFAALVDSKVRNIVTVVDGGAV